MCHDHDICHPTTPDSQQILKACPLLTSRITNAPLCVLGILLTLNLLYTLPIWHTIPPLSLPFDFLAEMEGHGTIV